MALTHDQRLLLRMLADVSARSAGSDPGARTASNHDRILASALGDWEPPQATAPAGGWIPFCRQPYFPVRGLDVIDDADPDSLVDRLMEAMYR